jgi:hypothetical protein
MSQKPPMALDELWEAIPVGPAPTDVVVSRGRVVRRRRRLAVIGVAASVVAVAVAATLVVRTNGDGHPVPTVTPPAGTRYVGIGHVVVAVPEGWADGAASCNSPYRDTVYFPWPQDCVGRFRSVSSVAISTVRMNSGVVGKPVADGRVGGHRVVAQPPLCMPGTGPEACIQTFGVPDLHVWFSVRVPRGVGAFEQVRAIRRSLTLLPDAQTAVPFVNPRSPLAAWQRALRDAGFVVRAHESTCRGNASCADRVTTTPAAGNVVPTGSTVTIEVH